MGFSPIDHDGPLPPFANTLLSQSTRKMPRQSPIFSLSPHDRNLRQYPRFPPPNSPIPPGTDHKLRPRPPSRRSVRLPATFIKANTSFGMNRGACAIPQDRYPEMRGRTNLKFFGLAITPPLSSGSLGWRPGWWLGCHGEYKMLVLQRSIGEQVQIGSGIVVTIVQCARGRVRLSIEAPHGTGVRRGELGILVNENSSLSPPPPNKPR